MKKKLIIAAVVLFAALTQPELFAQGEDNPLGVTGIFTEITTGGQYDIYTENARRTVDDIVVPGCVGAYPLKWTRYNNSRHEGLGYDGWTFSYDYRWDSAGIHLPDGTVIDPDSSSGGVEYTFDGGTSTLFLPDGGRVVFSPSMQVIDPYGQVTTIEYDSHYRINKVTEPGGRYLQINWSNAPDGLWYNTKIVSVYAFSGPAGSPNDHVMQSVSYGWGSVQSGNQWFTALQSVNYSDGTSASYTYEIVGGSPTTHRPAVLMADDVRYNGPMRQIAYQHGAGSKGGISLEKKPSGEMVSAVSSGSTQYDRIETRGDGATRTFTFGGKSGGLATPTTGKLLDYSDFASHHTTLGYEVSAVASMGFIKSVTDANNHATSWDTPPLTRAIRMLGSRAKITRISVTKSLPTTAPVRC